MPLINGWLRLNALNGSPLLLIQDGAPGHAAKATQEDLQERGVPVIWWPAYSPDLNPIKTVWDEMKDYIQDNYEEKLSQDQLRSAVYAAWNSILPEFLSELVDSMHDRCEVVVRANSMHKPY